jgi:hypothetical protein
MSDHNDMEKMVHHHSDYMTFEHTFYIDLKVVKVRENIGVECEVNKKKKGWKEKRKKKKGFYIQNKKKSRTNR